jgi:hypothetical protein
MIFFNISETHLREWIENEGKSEEAVFYLFNDFFCCCSTTFSPLAQFTSQKSSIKAQSMSTIFHVVRYLTWEHRDYFCNFLLFINVIFFLCVHNDALYFFLYDLITFKGLLKRLLHELKSLAPHSSQFIAEGHKKANSSNFRYFFP